MLRFRMYLVLSTLLVLGSVNAFAASYAVGTCKPSLHSFTTISAAVAAVPAFSTVYVCPGTYPEQVTINTALNLRGAISGNSGQVIITTPASGLSPNVTSIFQGLLVAQVGVTTGPVNITDIVVDGTGNSVNGSYWLAGVFYQGGSNGVVSNVTVRFANNSGMGTGIWVENGTANAESITIKNSDVHDVDNSGIVAGDATLAATVTNNWISSEAFGLDWAASGAATGNTITGGFEGVDQQSGSVSSNTIMNSPTGINTFTAGNTDNFNKIFNSTTSGINLGANGITAKSNIITEANVGIEFLCTSGQTVSGNKITDANVGLDLVPSTFSGSNSFYSVGTVRNGGCGSASVKRNTPVPVPLPTLKH